MYMAKRVFKNKRLMRSILILAVLLFIGFFLWTMLFKRSSVFEGQQVQQQNVLDAVTEIVGACRTKTDNQDGPFQYCVTIAVNNDLAKNFTLADANDAVTLKATNPSTSIVGNITSTVMKILQPDTIPNLDKVDEIVTDCRRTSMGQTDPLMRCVTPKIDCELACNFTEADFKQAHGNSFDMPGKSLVQHITEIVNGKLRELEKAGWKCPDSQRICPTKPPQQ